MGKLTNRFELRLSDEHLRRLEAITEDCGVSKKSDAVRWLINDAYKGVPPNASK